MILEIGLATLALGAYLAKRSRDNQAISPAIVAQREVIFDTAINSKLEPHQFRELASAYRTQGLIAQADMLEKRAALREASPEVKKQRNEVFHKAMESKDKAAVLGVAAAFQEMGATGAANNLRVYAQALESLASSDAELGNERNDEITP